MNEVSHAGLGVAFELDFSAEHAAAFKAALCAPAADPDFESGREFWEWILLTAIQTLDLKMDPGDFETLKPAVIQWLAGKIMDLAREAFELTFFNRQTVAFEQGKKALSQDAGDELEAMAFITNVVMIAAESGCVNLAGVSIPKMRPAVIRWLSLEITAAYQDAVTIPPE